MELNTVAIIGRATSQPFLIFTFLHYWNNTNFEYLYRICFMNYLLSLIVSNTWCMWAIHNNYHKTRSDNILLIYNFIEVSVSLWTNVMCFNFWRNIRKLQPNFSDSEREKLTYIKCLTYVWSCSLLYSIIGIVNCYLLKSQHQIFRVVQCILFAFQVVILFSNILMVMHSSIIIIKEMRAINHLRESGSIICTDNHKKKLIMYCKLFMITISLLCSKWLWASLSNTLTSDLVVYIVFEYLMVLNAFQGLAIFFLFGLPKQKIKKFKSQVSTLLSVTDNSITDE